MGLRVEHEIVDERDSFNGRFSQGCDLRSLVVGVVDRDDPADCGEFPTVV
jgi:hypothetical protein